DQVKKFDEHMEEVKKNVTELIELLPRALEKSFEVVEDKSLTHNQIGKKLQALIATNPQAATLIRFAFEQFMPKHGPHKGTHHGHRGVRHRGSISVKKEQIPNALSMI
ncbi:hypothetical protein TELCIR_23762, partial [Teladorsagia circumcincta]